MFSIIALVLTVFLFYTFKHNNEIVKKRELEKKENEIDENFKKEFFEEDIDK